MSTERKSVSVSGVIASLHSGKKREEIAAELELTKAEARVLFAHPKLKGLKTNSSALVSIDIIDDTEPTGGATDTGATSNVGSTATGEKAEAAPEKKAHKAAAQTETAQAEEMKVEDDTNSASPWDRKG